MHPSCVSVCIRLSIHRAIHNVHDNLFAGEEVEDVALLVVLEKLNFNFNGEGLLLVSNFFNFYIFSCLFLRVRCNCFAG